MDLNEIKQSAYAAAKELLHIERPGFARPKLLVVGCSSSEIAGGEIGHLPVCPEETETCGCGKKGCLEQYASATGIVRLAGKKLQETDVPSCLRQVETLTARDVLDAAKAGDALAKELLEEVCEILGRALAGVACVADPEAFIIGGGVSKAGPILTETISKYYKKYAFHASREAVFRLASLGNDAGMYGAVQLVLE